MGHCSASDAYTRRFDDTIQDMPRKFKDVDDTLLYDACVDDAFWHAYEFLNTRANAEVTLKPEKFKFCRREAEFVGFHLGWDPYQPTLEPLVAIRARHGQSTGAILCYNACHRAIPRASQENSWQESVLG